ncbi:NAD(P)-dependent oxidoreductase [Pseudophaeobacter sp.]|uniref:NAD(P)-dependent oxidoreductase n=1 Tax=Pseudophaeobacter sp. TaxID=1971739 RepID=UPI003A983C22
MGLLLLGPPERAAVWSEICSEVGEVFYHEVAPVEEVTYLACWQPPADLSVYPNLRVVICVGAGVDQMPVMPEGIALVRTYAASVDEMVRDWVVMATLMLHRDMPSYLEQAREGLWQGGAISLSRGAKVGIMGMGRIGSLAAETLGGMGFDVLGWSRSGRGPQDVRMFDASGIDAFLAEAETLICLLPLTSQTRGLMDDAFLAKLPEGARLVQAGRGAQLPLDALRRALESGKVASAMLDVTDPEPLSANHWAWSDPRVIVTPHVAGQTDAREGVEHALAVIRADRSREKLPGLVDQTLGY